LAGLDAERTTHALAIAASQSAGLIASFGSMTKPLHAGRAAQAGLLAARLAAQGFTGAVDALEHAKGLMRGISPGGRVDLESPNEAGRIWKLPVAGLNIKKYPSCFATHRALDGMLAIVEEEAIAPDAVARVQVTISRRNRSTLRFAAPQTVLEAKFSMQFAMAAALIARRCGLLELREAFVARPDVQALMRRIDVLPEDREDSRRPGEAPEDIVCVETTDGRRFVRKVAYVRGGPELPLRPGELFTKFESCLVSGGLHADAHALFEKFMTLEAQPCAAALYPPSHRTS
ncbi:MAG: MmgE/PrpD family protein, partial [Rhizobacter sp.]|nr:MmgE/PrpD family protein [Rhizobacter sp.]